MLGNMYSATIRLVCPTDPNVCTDLPVYVFALTKKQAINKLTTRYRLNSDGIRHISKCDIIASEVVWSESYDDDDYDDYGDMYRFDISDLFRNGEQ